MIATALIVLFVVKSIVIDLIVLWMLRESQFNLFEMIHFMETTHDRLAVLEDDSRNMSTAIMSIQSDLDPSILDDIG